MYIYIICNVHLPTKFVWRELSDVPEGVSTRVSLFGFCVFSSKYNQKQTYISILFHLYVISESFFTYNPLHSNKSDFSYQGQSMY